MPLTPIVEARADTVMSQAQRIAATIPPTPDTLAVPVDVLQTIFAALFALLRRLGPMVLNAILLLNINTLAVPVAALLNDPNLLDPPANSFHATAFFHGAFSGFRPISRPSLLGEPGRIGLSIVSPATMPLLSDV